MKLTSLSVFLCLSHTHTHLLSSTCWMFSRGSYAERFSEINISEADAFMGEYHFREPGGWVRGRDECVWAVWVSWGISHVLFCLCTLLCVATSSLWNPQNIFEAQTSPFTPPSVYTYPLYLSFPYFNISASFLQCPDSFHHHALSPLKWASWRWWNRKGC